MGTDTYGHFRSRCFNDSAFQQYTKPKIIRVNSFIFQLK